MIRRVLLLLLAALCLIAGGVAFLARHSFVREAVQVPSGWPPRALADDTLVLQRWLQHQGWQVSRRGGGFTEPPLPSGGLILLMRTDQAGLTRADATRLLAWVRAGGHLLVDATAAPLNTGEGCAALLREVGVETFALPPDQQPDHHTDEFPDSELVFAIRRSPEWRLKLDRSAWSLVLGSEAGDVLAEREEGHGTLQIASDLSFLYNASFPHLDHAAWLARVLGSAKSGSPCLVWSEPSDPNLLAWLRQKALPFLIACGALLFAWFWRGLWRFGPWLSPEPIARRSLLEHLMASGRFLWHQGGGPEALVAITRKAVLRRATRHFPAFARLSETARWDHLAIQSGLPQSDIAEALDDRPGVNSETLGRRLQMLLHLHHRLNPKP